MLSMSSDPIRTGTLVTAIVQRLAPGLQGEKMIANR
jgi:hypothetical protein